MNTAADRLKTFRALAADLHARLSPAFGLRLWDGSLVPAGWPAEGLAVAIADEGVVAALLRRPRLETIANLWAAERIDIRNGTLFDLAAARPATKTKRIWKQIDKALAFKLARQFMFVPRGTNWPLENVGRDRDGAGDAAQNKRNIAYHYDVSNAFYALWLDPDMVYSCAYFTEWDNALAQAQIDKLDMICRKLRLKTGDTFLDIGCGWGALVCHAARHYGVTALGVTLAQEQLALAQAKIGQLGLGDRVRVELRDYTAIDGQFDKIASVGMQEHVGAANYLAYFQTAHRLLRPGGLFLHHAITRPGKSAAARGRRKPKEFAALTRYIFPGGELDSIGRTVTTLEREGFEIHDVEGWREHYQRTCRHWHDNLLAHWDAAVAEVGTAKARVWLIYLAGCSLAFARNSVGIYQTLSSRRVKGSAGLPPTRADLYR